MLTRLKVSGFKNLVDVDVHFGPFTCIAGVNGVGKSNLFDALQFLSELADRPLTNAALTVGQERGRNTDLRNLFHRVGDEYAQEMSFEAEMIIPQTGFDDLGQPAKASSTFLRYSLVLAGRVNEERHALRSLEIRKEELVSLKKSEAANHLLFVNDADQWRDSVVVSQRRSPFFISTEETGDKRYIKLHRDRGGEDRSDGRRHSAFPAVSLPRTVLSAANAAESPTALLARREMQSWRLLQLEPSALRKPDPFTAPVRLGNDGSFLAATLYHLAWHRSNEEGREDASKEATAAGVYAEVANRLSDLINDVHDVEIERDERRELLTLYVAGRDSTRHPAHALSDGTLRFLALAVLELDPNAHGLLCLEEPENGIHPERIPALLRLLQDIATDMTEPVGPDNPFRQVIINTHSPEVVREVPEGSLLMAVISYALREGREYPVVRFQCLKDTWREAAGERPVAMGKLLSYLNPALPASRNDDEGNLSSNGHGLSQKVGDRPDIQRLMLSFEGDGA